MENILKKALGEVLTEKYSDELRDAYDTGYKFPEEFEERMNELVRRTDRPPIYRYRGWIAAAACVVLAVGSAVLIPALTDNSIKTDSSAESSVTETEPVPAETSVTSVSLTGGNMAVDTDNTTVSETTADPGEPEESSATAESTTATEETSSSGNDVKPSENDTVVPDDKPSDNGGPNVIVDAPGETEHHIIKVPAGTKLSKVFDDTFGISFDELWANYAEYCPEGVHTVGKYSNIYCSNAEYTFLQDFVHSLGGAECLEDGFAIEPGEAYITITVNTDKPKINEVNFINTSAWKYYDQFFSVSDDESYYITPRQEDDIAPADDYVVPGKTTPSFKVQIYKNSGCISFVSLDRYDPDTGKLDQYSIGYYRMNREAVDRLFGGFDEMYLSGEPQTVGDISSGLGITADGIVKAYADFDGIYDTSIYGAPLKPEYVESFFRKHGNKKLDRENAFGMVSGFTVMLKKGATLKVGLNVEEEKCYVTDGLGKYSFDITFDEIREVLKAAGDANGFTVPFYSTLGEYLEGKNFRTLSVVYCNVTKSDGKSYLVTVTDADELKTLYDMIAAELADAKYLPGYGGSIGEIEICVKGYSTIISLQTDDVLRIRTFGNNYFQLSAGFIKRFRDAVMNCTSAQWQELESEENGPNDTPSDD